MKQLTNTLGILSLFLCTVACLNAASFKEAKRIGIGETNAEPLSPDDQLVLKTTKGFLVIKISNPMYLQGNSNLVESCQIHWTVLEEDRVLTGRAESKIENKVTIGKDGGHTLERVRGSQAFSKAGLSISWSYASPNSVFIYFQPGQRYTIAREESSEEK